MCIIHPDAGRQIVHLAVFTADIIREDKSGLGKERAQCKQKLPGRLVWSKNARNRAKKLMVLIDITSG